MSKSSGLIRGTSKTFRGQNEGLVMPHRDSGMPFMPHLAQVEGIEGKVSGFAVLLVHVNNGGEQKNLRERDPEEKLPHGAFVDLFSSHAYSWSSAKSAIGGFKYTPYPSRQCNAGKRPKSCPTSNVFWCKNDGRRLRRHQAYPVNDDSTNTKKQNSAFSL